MSFLEKEKKRLQKMSIFEQRLKVQNYNTIAGVDEAGSGPLAGPVVAAACILPDDFFLAYLNDCKLLSKVQRERLYFEMIHRSDVFYGIGVVESKRIDEINILQASLEAMQIAVNTLAVLPDYVLVDGNFLPDLSVPGRAIVKGDTLSISIAAASVIAKYTRDRLMEEWHKKFPEYCFHEHKGYGTKKHRELLQQFGPCEIHRRSFSPVALLNKKKS